MKYTFSTLLAAGAVTIGMSGVALAEVKAGPAEGGSNTSSSPEPGVDQPSGKPTAPAPKTAAPEKPAATTAGSNSPSSGQATDIKQQEGKGATVQAGPNAATGVAVSGNAGAGGGGTPASQ